MSRRIDFVSTTYSVGRKDGRKRRLVATRNDRSNDLKAENYAIGTIVNFTAINFNGRRERKCDNPSLHFSKRGSNSVRLYVILLHAEDYYRGSKATRRLWLKREVSRVPTEHWDPRAPVSRKGIAIQPSEWSSREEQGAVCCNSLLAIELPFILPSNHSRCLPLWSVRFVFLDTNCTLALYTRCKLGL